MPFSLAHPALRAALVDRGYTAPTPVQAAVLGAEQGDGDLLVSAQTGSGKTVAYGLALGPTLLGEATMFERAIAPLALIVAPTRELALQIQRELEWLYRRARARIATCVGGMDIRGDERALAAGPHIVVGTPGRLCDHLDRGTLVLTQLRAVVLDEADEMLDLGFREELERILEMTPEGRRTLLFSATIPRPIAALAKKYQRDAVRIAASAEGEKHGDIEYRVMMIAAGDRERAVVNVLRYFEARGALIFCSTRDAVQKLTSSLLERGFSVVALSGELSQNERVRALAALRDGRARVCVATDVAARGLDLPDLGLVLHAELPKDKQILVHRSGRTGRAGKKGSSVLLATYPARRNAERLLAAAGVEAQFGPPPSAGEVRARDQERLAAEIGAQLEHSGEEDRVLARALLAKHEPEALAAALVHLRRQELPAAEELSESLSLRPPPPTPAARPWAAPTETVIFRMNVGRSANAEPRWLVPLLCRRGHIGKESIGRIRILQHETQFEIAKDVAERFAAAAARPDPQDRSVLIVPAGGDGRGPGDRPSRPRAPRSSPGAAPRRSAPGATAPRSAPTAPARRSAPGATAPRSAPTAPARRSSPGATARPTPARSGDTPPARPGHAPPARSGDTPPARPYRYVGKPGKQKKPR